MSEQKEVKKTYAPVYVALYPELVPEFRKHGYALAIHGSVTRDFDLVAVPWVEIVSKPQEVVDEVFKAFRVKFEGKPTVKEHGRLVYTISVGFGECFIDLSFIGITP